MSSNIKDESNIKSIQNDDDKSKIESKSEQNADDNADQLVPSQSHVDVFKEEAIRPLIETKKIDISRQDRMGFERFFQSPIMKELEEATAKNLAVLEELEEKMKRERKEAELARLTSHIPTEIKGRGQSKDDIMKCIESIILKSNKTPVEPTLVTKSPSLNSRKTCSINDAKHENDSLNEIIYFSLNLMAHLKSHSNEFNLSAISSELYANVALWLSRLFRFFDSQVIFHDHNYECVVHMCNLILNIKYDNLSEDGYRLLHEKQPVVYVSSASRYASEDTRRKICVKLRLPYESLRVIKAYEQVGSWFDKMNTNEFIETIDEDISSGKTPVLLIANAGSFRAGQCDDIQELERICTHYKIWLHLDGIQLSTLALYSVPNEIQPINSGDSISLDLGLWMGIPSLSYVTLYKNVSSSFELMQRINPMCDYLDKLLQYWCLLQSLGHDRVLEKIKYASDLSRHFEDTLTKHQPFLKRIVFKDDPNAQVDVTTRRYTFTELVSKALSFLTYVEYHSPIVVFKCNTQFIKDKLIQLNPTLSESPLEWVDEYCNELTAWLCELFNSEHKKLRLECIRIAYEGVCIRYSPLEHTQILKTQDEDMINFLRSFEEVVLILDSSIKCKALFNHRICKEMYPNLRTISLDKWAGIGAVCYVPDYFVDRELNEKAKDEINKLNIELVRVLQSKDGAYSLGMTSDGLYGVKFGMVNDTESLDSLATQVQQQGKRVEESSKFIEIMSDVIRQGIQQANDDLRKETEQRGVLRQIPFVSELVTWWSGDNGKTQPLMGRTFDLQSGRIISTHNTFKYHMQMQTNESEDSTTDTTTSASTRVTKSTTQSSSCSSSVIDEEK